MLGKERSGIMVMIVDGPSLLHRRLFVIVFGD